MVIVESDNENQKEQETESTVNCLRSAIQHYQQGNLLKAKQACEVALTHNPRSALAIGLLATIQTDLGNVEQADRLFKESLLIDPRQPDILNNYAGLLINREEFEAASKLSKRAIKIAPHSAGYYVRMGYALWKAEKHREALQVSIKAIKLNPSMVDAYRNLGVIYKDLGRLDQAISATLKAVELKPYNSNVHINLVEIFREANPTETNKELLDKIYEALIHRVDITHTKIWHIFKNAYADKIACIASPTKSIATRKEILFGLASDRCFKKSLTLFVIPSASYEYSLSLIRKEVLAEAVRGKIIEQKILPLIEALAVQCFLNEYIYEVSEIESKNLEILLDACRKNKEVGLLVLPIIGCYIPLQTLIKDFTWITDYGSAREESQWMNQILINEPLMEAELSQSIRSIGNIKDKVSVAVKLQYEKNPYPRWRYVNYSSEGSGSSTADIIKQETSKPELSFNTTSSSQDGFKVLIAGCGTGKQVVEANRYYNAKITAIDLSRQSLAYAKRKADEYRMENVDFILIDLLDIYMLEEEYDLIECAGVLHHMDNPSKGLSILTERLVRGGYMKLGLYSKEARKDITAARQFIQTQNIESTSIGIRKFRREVFTGCSRQLGSLTTASDFYSMSECRDLCFHVQEHCFTITQLSELLDINNLQFCGFMLSNAVRESYVAQYPEDTSMTDFKNWGEYESQYPHTFRGMYQFWVRKN